MSLDQLRDRFACNDGLPFADVLTGPRIRQALDEHGVRYRDRVFDPVTTTWGFLSQVLSDDHSCRDAVARVIAHRAAGGLETCSPNTASYCNARGRPPTAVLTPWPGGPKSYEITAIPELLKKIDLRGGVVMIDAMGAQKAIAGEVIRGKADYVLALKKNHETPHREVVEYIDEQLEGELEAAQELTTTVRGHGRVEERTYLQLPAPEDLPRKGEWQGLKSVGVVTSRRAQGDKESIEVRYYLSSLPVGVGQFARAVRGHWSVENACHWSLDVTFREDDSRVRERVLGSNITWLYRFTLSILKQHPDRRQSLIMKRRGCGWSDTFLMEVIGTLTC
jgi:predicted transposase YbfD/YdcC